MIAVSTKLDMSGLKEIKKKLGNLERDKVEWGFLGGTHSQANIPYASIAWELEFGGKSSDGYIIPPRPAFRESIQELRLSNGFKDYVRVSFSKYLHGPSSTSPKHFLEDCGEYLKESYRSSMANWHTEGSQNRSNAPWTIKEKGFDQPYVESGELLQNVKFRIV